MKLKIVKTGGGMHRFELRRSGLFYAPQSEEKRRICGRIYVAGLASHENSSDLFVAFRVRNTNGISQDLYMRRSEFRRCDTVMQFLSDQWPDCPATNEDEKLLFIFLKSYKPTLKYVLLQRTGWFKGAYVFPDIVIGSAEPIPKYKTGISRGGEHPPVGGTLRAWRNTVGKPAKHSDRITFALSVSFYALLLPLFSGESSTTFHMFGLSGHGKTVLLTAAQSIHGWAGRDDLNHWEVTRTGLSELAAEHCDRLLTLDELARLGADEKEIAKNARDASFKLASGHGRIRSVHFGKSGNPTNWRVVVLSNGEIGISENAAVIGKDRLAGDIVRLIDIPAVASPEHGVFNDIPKGYQNSESAITALEMATAENFGHPAREFVRQLVANKDECIAHLEKWEARFFKKARVPTDKWERRFARRFARAYAAGMLARKFKLVPWSAKWTRVAATRCYQAARQAVPDHGLMLQDAQMALQGRLRDKSVMIDLTTSKPKANAVATAQGFIKADSKYGLFYAIRPDVLQTWIGPKLDVRVFAQHLDRQGMLVKTRRNTLTKPVMIAGIKGKPRYYCLRRSAPKTGEST